jgi:hypothetical protein
VGDRGVGSQYAGPHSCRFVTLRFCYILCVIESFTGDDADLIYQLDLHAMELCRLVHTWRAKVQTLPGGQGLESWGPSELALQQAAMDKVTGSWDETAEDLEESGNSDMSSEAGWTDIADGESDGELLESVEAVAFADEYRVLDIDLYDQDNYSNELYGRDKTSPNKRFRE